MRAVHKRILTDESMHPVAVQVDYQDWLEIERELDLRSETAKSVDLSRFHGVITLKEDPLQFQQSVRSEWR